MADNGEPSRYLEDSEMRYNRTVEARFVSRPNRFIAQVELDGKIETVHVKNTVRCKELLLPNSRVILSEAESCS